MSKYGGCPECEIGDLHVEEYIPDWGSEEDASYNLVCSHCDYSEDIDLDDEDLEED